MRILGRLAMAAALLVPGSMALASHAGASGGGFSCSGTTGSLTATPGFLLSNSGPQTLKVVSNGLTCTGGFVTGGNLVGSLQTADYRCGSIIGHNGNGTGTLTWTSPANMGKTTAKLNFKFTGTSGHTTTGTISGVVTTNGSNLAAGKAITGAFTLNKGLRSTASGGDCTVTKRLKNFGVTAISLHT